MHPTRPSPPSLPEPPEPPDRVRLLAGLVVARRDDRLLQVGLDAPHRVIAPDEPDVRRVLADLQAGRPAAPTTAAGVRCAEDLRAAGLLSRVAEDRDRTERRARARVLVDAAPALRAGIETLLLAAGVRADGRGGPATVVAVVADGEVARERLDVLVREGRPHLVVSGAAAAVGATLGPFVVPGTTACTRCVDARLGEDDPRRVVVLEQVAALEDVRRGAAAARDPVADALVAAWVARDLLAHVDGDTPWTWSATVRLDRQGPRRRAWTRHPHCGCTWGDALSA